MAEQSREGQTSERSESGAREPSFFHIIETMALPALIYTGHLRNPLDENAAPNLEMARYQIAMLEILESRTRGNLEPDEARYLEEMLHTVRLAYVRASKPAPGKASEQPPAGGEEPAAGVDRGEANAQ